VALPFPNVPNLPGVPPVPRSPALTPTEIATLGTDAISSVLWQSAQAPPQWGIFDTAGNQLVDPDSIIDFSNRNEWDVATFPVQQGTFASYNKVKAPSEYMVRMTKGGGPQSSSGSPFANLAGALVATSQPLSQAQADYYALSQSALLQGVVGASPTNSGAGARQAFLQQIDTLAGSTQLVRILTPEWAYLSVNVTRYEVTRRGAAGAFFLDVDVYFIQVIEVSAQYQSTSDTSNAQDATAQPATNVGYVQPQAVDPQTEGAAIYAYQFNNAIAVD
jgi:hypothetical protein